MEIKFEAIYTGFVNAMEHRNLIEFLGRTWTVKTD
jgi:hypothetical protein